MITIIHGDDIVASRTHFLETKQKYPTAPLLDGEKVTLTDLAQIFEGGGFFDEHKIVFIEQFFSRKNKKEEFAAFASYLQKQTAHTIYLWEEKELEISALSAIKTATPRVFKLPLTLFSLLDNLKPKNGKILINLFHKTLTATEPEMVFYMLVRQVRLLLALSPVIPAKAGIQNGVKPEDDKESVIDEIKRLRPWQKSKMEQQARLFTKQELLTLYKRFFALEIAQKTGTLSGTLTANVDFLLLTI